MKKEINFLLGYKELKIIQDEEMFKCSLDAILLARFVTINKSCKKILDIGSGNCPIPLVLSTRTNAKIDAIEIQKKVYELGLETIKHNNKENQITIYNDDINAFANKFDNEEYDVIVSNPPYFKYLETSNINDSDYKTIARHEKTLNLNQLLKISRKLLKNNGILALVHRPERLSDIIVEMRNKNIEPKKLQLIYPKDSKEANILLIEGRKNGQPGLKVLPPIISHDENGEYTEGIKNNFE